MDLLEWSSALDRTVASGPGYCTGLVEVWAPGAAPGIRRMTAPAPQRGSGSRCGQNSRAQGSSQGA